MLNDRPYMRSEYPERSTSALVWLIAVLVAGFAVQLVLLSPWLGSSSGDLVDQLSLTVRSLQNGHLWTLLSHSLLHSVSNPLQIVAVILGLVFIGRELEPLLGSRRFVSVFIASIVSGALCWAAVNWSTGGVHVGASAGVLGLFVVLACLYPDQELKFLLLFLVPVTVRPKYFVLGLLTLNALALSFYEIQGSAVPLGYSPSVHLGGMLAGWLYFRYFHANNGWDRAPTLEIPAWIRRNEKPKPEALVLPAKTVRSAASLRAEVDQILDKINSHGFGALTDDEKRLLDEAKDMLSRS